VGHNDRLTLGQVAGWGTLGFITGVAAGVLLSAWAGDVNQGRLERAARRLRANAPEKTGSASAVARATGAALRTAPGLEGLSLDAVGVARGVVELRGWVPSRNHRALAGRTGRAVPGVQTLINNILVRGEDDRSITPLPRPTDQSA
jgi:hypothetical protein